MVIGPMQMNFVGINQPTSKGSPVLRHLGNRDFNDMVELRFQGLEKSEAITPINRTKLLNSATTACIDAGQIILQSFEQPKTVEIKSTERSGDVVTQTDREADATIQKILKAADPSATMITEETFDPKTLKNLDRAWIVDPLDGTSNFANSIPQNAVSIAYIEHGKTTVAAVLDVHRKILYTAIKGQGAYAQNLEGPPNKRKLQVNDKTRIQDGKFATDFTALKYGENYSAFQWMNENSMGVLRPGAGVLDITHAATGEFTGIWHRATYPWDIAAGILLVEEAGGKVSNVHGRPVDIGQPIVEIVASNGLVHNELLKALQASMDF